MRDKLLSLRPLLRSPAFWVAVLAVAGLLWAYWTTLGGLAERWSNAPQYSHGFLVPGFALAVLWFRRKHLKPERLAPNGWGLLLVVAGLAVRLVGAFFYYPWLDALSLLPSIAGLCLLLGGWHAVRWAWPAIGFLLFMLPLPYVAEGALARPLQRFATLSSTYLLQTLGFPATAHGNIVTVHTTHVGVAEACNGLGMLVLFFALAAAVAFVVNRPLWQKLLLVASAIPVALVANVIRITTTAVVGETINQAVAEQAFHDYAGWLMMPLALLLLGAEMWLLTWLFFTPVGRGAGSLPVPGVGLPAHPAARKGGPGRRGRPHKKAFSSVRPKD